MNIKLIDTDANRQVYYNLAQAYEAEFSAITEKQPDKTGRFELDTPLDEHHFAYLLLDYNIPLGFANIAHSNTADEGKQFEVCEFYIIPSARKQHLGTKLITKIWQNQPGQWRIKQLDNALHATIFWRRTLESQNINYVESQFTDEFWGDVVEQSFVIAE